MNKIWRRQCSSSRPSGTVSHVSYLQPSRYHLCMYGNETGSPCGCNFQTEPSAFMRSLLSRQIWINVKRFLAFFKVPVVSLLHVPWRSSPKRFLGLKGKPWVWHQDRIAATKICKLREKTSQPICNAHEWKIARRAYAKHCFECAAAALDFSYRLRHLNRRNSKVNFKPCRPLPGGKLAEYALMLTPIQTNKQTFKCAELIFSRACRPDNGQHAFCRSSPLGSLTSPLLVGNLILFCWWRVRPGGSSRPLHFHTPIPMSWTPRWLTNLCVRAGTLVSLAQPSAVFSSETKWWGCSGGMENEMRGSGERMEWSVVARWSGKRNGVQGSRCPGSWHDRVCRRTAK